MSISHHRISWLAALLALCFAGAASGQVPPQQGDPSLPPGFPPQPRTVGPPVSFELISPVERVAPGATFPLALRVKMQPTWHINVPNPPKGDGYFAGAYATTITTNLPEGFKAGEHQWPEAHDVVMGRGTPAEQKILCIEGTQHIYLPIKVVSNAPAGTAEIEVTVDYQACDYTKCLPPTQRTFTVSVEVDPDAPAPSWSDNPRFNDYDAYLGAVHPLMMTAKLQSDDPVAPGSDVMAIVTISLEPKWHVWGPVPVQVPSLGFETLASELTIRHAGEELELGNAQWPEPHEFKYPGLDDLVPAHEGTFDIRVPVRLPDALEDGSAALEVVLFNQVCDDTQCMEPRETTATLTVQIDANAEKTTIAGLGDGVTGQNAGSLPEKDTPSSEATSDEGSTALDIDELGFVNFSIDTSGLFGILLVILLAAVAGFVLNLTPCVLPIIPIKIMGLTQTAGNPRRALLLGSVMAAGVVSFWMVIGVLIISLSSFNAISDIFRLPEFVLGIGIFIFAMGFGMLGIFTVQLPKAVYMINPNHESVGGAFFFGVMTAVLSTPCTAPFMGAVTAWATAANNSVLVLTVFGAIGAGMASPYLVLSAFPKLVSKVPRTGPASELVKQTMGMLMIAVSFFFLGTGVIALASKYPGLGFALYWWIIVLLVAIAGCWLVMRTKALTTRPGPIIGTAIGSVLVTGGLAWWSVGQTRLSMSAALGELTARQKEQAYIAELEKAIREGGGDVHLAKRTWSPYTPEAYEAAINAGKTVLLEFDAVW